MKLFDVYPLYDIEPEHGKGAYIYDKNGTEYLDFYGGHAVISIGHSHPHFVKRLKEQIEKLAFYSNSIQNPLQWELAAKLGKVSGFKNYNLFLCNSGAEAMENALKLASFQTGKSKVIAFKRCFHGRTSAAVNITDKEAIKAPINKGFETEFLELNDIESIERVLQTETTCAVVVEGIQGWGGVYVPNADFLVQLEILCKQHGALLILDEIQSGYGRSGHFFAFQESGIQPDLITMAKGMGNGFPVGGVLIRDHIPAKHGRLGTTFGGNHLACAAALAVLEVFENENVLQNVQKQSAYLKKALEDIPQIKSIRGRGLILGLELDQPVKELRKNLIFKHQVFTGSALDPKTLRLLPPLTITKEDTDLFISKLKEALLNQEKELSKPVINYKK